VTSGSEIRVGKQSEPSSLLVQEYAAALMRVTLRGFWGYWRNRIGISGKGSGSFGSGDDNGNVFDRG